MRAEQARVAHEKQVEIAPPQENSKTRTEDLRRPEQEKQHAMEARGSATVDPRGVPAHGNAAPLSTHPGTPGHSKDSKDKEKDKDKQ
jgi:hypothetical protein